MIEEWLSQNLVFGIQISGFGSGLGLEMWGGGSFESAGAADSVGWMEQLR
jgi:hypothetical protein